MKKIVLAYNFGGVKNQLESLDSIYKVKPLDFNEMKNKINLVLQLSEDEIHAMGNIARQRIIDLFSNENMLSSYNNFYQEIVS